MAIEVKVFSSAEAVGRDEWNRLAVAVSPMMEWEYFFALEESGVVSQQRGYRPCHLVAYEDRQAVVLAPFYERDRAWVEFGDGGLVELLSEMTGIPFNFGMVGAIPYTPVPGYQFLHSVTVEPLQAFRSVLDYLDHYCESRNLSTSRLYFVSSASSQLHALLKEQGYVPMRTEYSLWFNHNYTHFEEYLLALKSSRRTKIRRELRAIREQEIAISMVPGRDAPWEYFDSIHTLYERTWTKHMGSRIRPFLNERFFHLLAENFKHRITFAVAQQAAKRVAMAFFYSKQGTLYGRYWGCFQEIPFLHFATCYYHPIAYAIKHGMTRMDPGFGGEHKLLRGYEMIPAYHYLKFYGERQRRVAYSILKQLNLQNPVI